MPHDSENHVNLLDDRSDRPDALPQQRPFFLFNKVFLSVVTVLTVIGIAFSTTTPSGDVEAIDAEPQGFLTTIRQIVTSGDKELRGEAEDRINLLLLGVGGAGHDGPQLSDTIIYSSIRPSTGDVGMLSIPRDLNVPIDGYGWRKINHVNAYGEQIDPGSGAAFAADTIGELFEEEVHYYVRVDFSGFEEFIDAIGGVDIYVERTFTDTAYPLDDGEGSIETITFEEGWQAMDGETALKFARSRHGDNGEGSDFARAVRQQKVLLAVRKKVLSVGTLLNPGRINRMITTLSSNIQTNMAPWEVLRFANMAKDFETNTINNVVLDTRPGSPLYETNVNGAYVILPKGSNWQPIQAIVDDIFDVNDITVARTPASSEPHVRVEIQNGTNVTGLASETSQRLLAQGIEVTSIGNAEDRSWPRTVIYDFSDGRFDLQLEELRTYLDADVYQETAGWIRGGEVVPDQLFTNLDTAEALAQEDTIDFLIILGQSSAHIARR